MTGAEHYTEAERLLKLGPDAELRAQVHATLALAAARVDTASGTVLANCDGWMAVTSS